MRLWVDDLRPAPEGYVWCKSVEKARQMIEHWENCANHHNPVVREIYAVELIDLDHDAGVYGPPDYIKLLDWLEETGRNYPIRIHSMNPVGVANMRRIIERNGWAEVK